MSKKNLFFKYKGVELHYARYGNGPKAVLAFHGFGQSHNDLACLERTLGPQYSLYSFDLFFHGHSSWPHKDRPLSKGFLQELMAAFLKEHQLNKFSLLGFSMGGKLALACVEAFPDRVDQLILIAPDGVKTNFWYTAITWPRILRSYFRRTIVKPQFFFNLLHLLERSGLVHKKLGRFTNSQMNSISKRRQVYYSWVVFRKLKFNIKQISRALNQNKVKVQVFIGKYDRVITLKDMKKFEKNVEKYELIVLKSGHTTLISEVCKYFEKHTL